MVAVRTIADARKQFSKRLATWTAVFWFLYMTWLSVIPVIQPEAAVYAVYLAVISTIVMMLNVGAYTRNSIYEKSMTAMLDKTKMELTLGSGKKKEDTEEEGDDG